MKLSKSERRMISEIAAPTEREPIPIYIVMGTAKPHLFATGEEIVTARIEVGCDWLISAFRWSLMK